MEQCAGLVVRFPNPNSRLAKALKLDNRNHDLQVVAIIIAPSFMTEKVQKVKNGFSRTRLNPKKPYPPPSTSTQQLVSFP